MITSVIVPVYNGENYIEKTLLSILANTNSTDCEVLVIDDGSTDSTSDICKLFADRIRYFRQENQGEYAATNRGILQAIGKYILVVSHDDPMLSPNLLPKAIALLEDQNQLSCVYPDWQIINSEGTVIGTRIVNEYSENELIGKFNCLPGPGAVFRRQHALEIGGRNNWKFVSDYDFWLRLSRVGDFQRIPGVLAQWRSHNQSTSLSQKTLEMAEERIKVMELFLASSDIDKKLARRGISSAYYFAARLGFFAPQIPSKKWLMLSFTKRKSWPEVAKPSIVILILTLPFSAKFLKVLSRKIHRFRDLV